MTTEYLLYGLRAGETERYTEELLASRLASEEAANAIIEIAKLDGFHSFRVATYDGAPPDFTKVLRSKRKGKR